MKKSTLRLLIALLAIILAAGAFTVVFASEDVSADGTTVDGTTTDGVTKDPETCSHKNTTSVLKDFDQSLHTYGIVCEDCGSITEYEQTKHTWVNGRCSVCSAGCAHLDWYTNTCTNCQLVCTHPHLNMGVCLTCDTCVHSSRIHKYTPKDNSQHLRTTSCACGYIEEKTTQAHSYNDLGYCAACDYYCTHSYSNGVCTHCGRSEDDDSCNHSGATTTYVSSNDESHKVIVTCSCGYSKTTYLNHDYYSNSLSYEEDEGYCSSCEHTCAHTSYVAGACATCGKTAE